jgi:hypothetical protein
MPLIDTAGITTEAAFASILVGEAAEGFAIGLGAREGGAESLPVARRILLKLFAAGLGGAAGNVTFDASLQGLGKALQNRPISYKEIGAAGIFGFAFGALLRAVSLAVGRFVFQPLQRFFRGPTDANVVRDAADNVAPVVEGASPPQIKPGAVGLGLDDQLSSLRRSGATTYNQWFEQGLTKVRPEQANLDPCYFEKAFTDAASKAPQLAFDITDVDVPRALQDGSRGFVSKNYTNAELYRIVNNPKWLEKTVFLRNGVPQMPIIEGGKVTGFSPWKG